MKSLNFSCNVCGMDDSASNTLRSLLGKMEPPPMSSAEAYPTFLYKISPVLSVQQSPSMVQSSSSSKQTITSIMSSNMSSNMITSASNSLALEEMGLRRTRTVIPNSVKVQIAKVANQIPRMTQGEIAQMFGIDRTTVSKILKRRREYLSPDSESPPRAKYNCCKFPHLNWKPISFSFSFLAFKKRYNSIQLRYEKSLVHNIAPTVLLSLWLWLLHTLGKPFLDESTMDTLPFTISIIKKKNTEFFT